MLSRVSDRVGAAVAVRPVPSLPRCRQVGSIGSLLLRPGLLAAHEETMHKLLDVLSGTPPYIFLLWLFLSGRVTHRR